MLFLYHTHSRVYDVLMDSSKDWVYGIYCVEMSHPLNPQKYTHLYSWSSSLSFPEYPLHIYAHTQFRKMVQTSLKTNWINDFGGDGGGGGVDALLCNF